MRGKLSPFVPRDLVASSKPTSLSDHFDCKQDGEGDMCYSNSQRIKLYPSEYVEKQKQYASVFMSPHNSLWSK